LPGYAKLTRNLWNRDIESKVVIPLLSLAVLAGAIEDLADVLVLLDQASGASGRECRSDSHRGE